MATLADRFVDPVGTAVKTGVFATGTLALAGMVLAALLSSTAGGLFLWMIAMLYWFPLAGWYAGSMSSATIAPTGDPQLDAHKRLLARVHARGDERLDEVCKRLEGHWRATHRRLRELDRAVSEQRIASSSGDAPRKWLDERRAETALELARVSEAMRWLHAAVVASGAEDDDSSVSEALAAAEAVLEVDRALKRAPLGTATPPRPHVLAEAH